MSKHHLTLATGIAASAMIAGCTFSMAPAIPAPTEERLSAASARAPRPARENRGREMPSGTSALAGGPAPLGLRAATSAGPAATRAKDAHAYAAFLSPSPTETERPADSQRWTEAPGRFVSPLDEPLSTFSVDVDTAAYSQVRRMLREGQLPNAGLVRIEELLNYFSYDYPPPKEDHPISIAVEAAAAPWDEAHRLVRVGLQAKTFAAGERPPTHLVFLIDVSGSMAPPDRLPLVRESLELLVEQLDQRDLISIVTCAGGATRVLAPTSGSEKGKIRAAIRRLEAKGSTAGGAGLQLAYRTAREGHIQGGNHRVVLATDGDFNVGETSHEGLLRLIEAEAGRGVQLTVLGYGMGNYQDQMLEQLTNRGDGNYAYIDTLEEAQKVLVHQMGGTLHTVAHDVKIQVEMNPDMVQSYRLIGYDNRALAAEDFQDDRKDAGEMGAGHAVTALYEVVLAEPVGSGHQRPAAELMSVKVRYKRPGETQSQLLTEPVVDRGLGIGDASDDLRFAAAVASFGMMLRDFEAPGTPDPKKVRQWAERALGKDPLGRRREFVELLGFVKR